MKTGRTTRQIETAEYGAVYVCPAQADVAYAEKIAENLGRTDITFVSPLWIHRWCYLRPNISDVVIDHAARLTLNQKESLRHAQTRIKPLENNQSRSPAEEALIPYTDRELFQRALNSLPRILADSEAPKPLWSMVSRLFGCGPETAHKICWRYGFDPDTAYWVRNNLLIKGAVPTTPQPPEKGTE